MNFPVQKLFVIPVLLIIMTNPKPVPSREAAQDEYYAQARENLESLVYTHDAVAKWICGKVTYGEAYHGVLGWVHNPRVIQHGIDGSHAIYEYDSDGARRVITHAGRPCRINTYGNSFTSCEQVNDAETWQEMLAAHLCEPVRNFGIGGYSVYQSYRRMLLEESETPADYIIFNIYSDDHYRNLTGWRNIRLGYTVEMRPDVSSPTLPYIKSNPATEEFIELDNPCPTPEDVYRLCDPDWVFERFKDNFVLKMILAKRNIRNGTPEKSYAMMQALVKEHGIEMTIDDALSLREAADRVFTNAGIFASQRIVDKVNDYVARNGKRVLYVLSYGENVLKDTLETGIRFDQPFIDYLDEKKLPYVDLLDAHFQDFAKYNISVDQYAGQYWIGHYAPQGNFFQAYAIKDKLIEMLEPKPAPYLPTDRATFESPWEGGKKPTPRQN